MDDLKKNGECYADPTAYEAIKTTYSQQDVYRGDIFYIQKGGEKVGSEYNGGRPAVVVSNDKNNKYSSVVEVVWITSGEKKPLPTHCEVICKVPSTVLCEQITSVSKDRLSEYIRTCTTEEMARIDRCLSVSLGLPEDPMESTAYKKLEEACMKAMDHNKNVEKKCELMNAGINALQAANADLKEQLRDERSKAAFADDTKLLKERDLYKSLYEHILEVALEG